MVGGDFNVLSSCWHADGERNCAPTRTDANDLQAPRTGQDFCREHPSAGATAAEGRLAATVADLTGFYKRAPPRCGSDPPCGLWKAARTRVGLVQRFGGPHRHAPAKGRFRGMRSVSGGAYTSGCLVAAWRRRRVLSAARSREPRSWVAAPARASESPRHTNPLTVCRDARGHPACRNRRLLRGGTARRRFLAHPEVCAAEAIPKWRATLATDLRIDDTGYVATRVQPVQVRYRYSCTVGLQLSFFQSPQDGGCGQQPGPYPIRLQGRLPAPRRSRYAANCWVFITQLHIHTMRGNAHTST